MSGLRRSIKEQVRLYLPTRYSLSSNIAIIRLHALVVFQSFEVKIFNIRLAIANNYIFSPVSSPRSFNFDDAYVTWANNVLHIKSYFIFTPAPVKPTGLELIAVNATSVIVRWDHQVASYYNLHGYAEGVRFADYFGPGYTYRFSELPHASEFGFKLWGVFDGKDSDWSYVTYRRELYSINYTLNLYIQNSTILHVLPRFRHMTIIVFLIYLQLCSQQKLLKQKKRKQT